MKRIKWGRLVLALVLSYSAAVVGGVYTAQGLGAWYEGLNKPFFQPPSWLFGPVWTVLYFTMAASLYLVWNKSKGDRLREVWVLFLAQLFLNISWTYLFFAARMIALAFGEIVLLWLVIWKMRKVYLKIDKRTGKLLIPYLAWVGFAGVLNLAIVVLN